MNYGQLKTAFENRLKRRDHATSATGSYIQEGIARIQRKLRVPAMEVRTAIEIGSDYDPNIGLEVPDDLLGLISIYTSEGKVIRKDLDSVLAAGKQAGTPKVFCQVGSYYLLGPYPQVGDKIYIHYHAELPELASDSDTNFLSIIAPDVIIYGALITAADDYLDRRGPVWEARFDKYLQEMMDQAAADELSSGVVGPGIQFDDEL